MQEKTIFPIFYLPPISYFTALKAQNTPIFFEIEEHFPKQTYRNRASIYSANGKLDLHIPVKKGANLHTKMKNVRISESENWQRLHWQSMQTCYRSSAYFEYYEHDFERFYTQKFENLHLFNMELLALLFKFLKWDLPINYTHDYEKLEDESKDFRTILHPKKAIIFPMKPYYQVFENKYGFIADLSIVDLLFHKGPQSMQFI